MTNFINGILEQLAFLIMESSWFSPLIALIAGIITALSPCCLASVPLIMGYVGGTSRSTKESFMLSLTFAVGMILSSVALGVSVAFIGAVVKFYIQGGWFYVVLGFFMILMALQVWEIFNFIPSTKFLGKSKKRGHIGAFIAGLVGGVFSSPCSTPILVALLTLVMQQGDFLKGGVLLLIYSIGHSVLFILAGTFTGHFKRYMRSNSYGKTNQVVKILTGSIILLLGFYLIYLGI